MSLGFLLSGSFAIQKHNYVTYAAALGADGLSLLSRDAKTVTA